MNNIWQLKSSKYSIPNGFIHISSAVNCFAEALLNMKNFLRGVTINKSCV